ncbi:hypothetical protein MSAN_01178200 [Mycena sanguinolenta]|uniref:Uncharacterized protein n=1 Tax=Mycena sanguinolenta TaxID=230812 RepID=A0A8H7D793_9AGAR|nr:hypothetical protein MSAN_01178200 [Mycena sanguinolenta]
MTYSTVTLEVPKMLPRSISKPEPTFLYPTGQSRTLTRSVSAPDLTLAAQTNATTDILRVLDVPPGVATAEAPDVPEDADLARAIAQSLQEAEMQLQQRPRSDILPGAEKTLPSADMAGDLEDADLARAIARSLQDMKLQQPPRLNIPPAVLNAPVTADVPDNKIVCPVATDLPEIINTLKVLELSSQPHTNEGELCSYSCEDSTLGSDDLGKDALQSLGPLATSLIIAGRSKGEARVRHTGGDGGRGEGPTLGHMNFHNSFINLIINGGTGGDGGAAGFIGGNGGTGQGPIIKHAVHTRRSSFSALPPLPPRPWRE